jgi:hypothetical protein
VDLALASNGLPFREDGGDDVGLKLEVLGVWKMEKIKIVEVIWLDTYHVSGGGLTRKEVSELAPVPCLSYGRLLEETDDHITVASNVMEHRGDSEQPEYREVTCIPRAVIQSIKELR